MTYELSVNHSFFFEFLRPDNNVELPHWPDRLPWPEWKPSTEKGMRPSRLAFTIDYRSGDTWPLGGTSHRPKVTVHGPRLNKGGEGAVADNVYYGYSGYPQFIEDIVNEAIARVNLIIAGHSLNKAEL